MVDGLVGLFVGWLMVDELIDWLAYLLVGWLVDG
jgi:hypothetical protein